MTYIVGTTDCIYEEEVESESESFKITTMSQCMNSIAYSRTCSRYFGGEKALKVRVLGKHRKTAENNDDDVIIQDSMLNCVRKLK